MDGRELAARIARGEAPVVIDVRSGFEYRAGHIPGAPHLPTSHIPFRRGRLPENRDERLVLTCEHGPRAQLAARVLRFLGFKNVELLEGHMAAWRTAKLPMDTTAKN
ncbi:MAG TPA: rhodanese-like domain-containing protein [Deferrisomatales bacterium]|nr:rhodanese-like domain-containing protein [Deferrisomatales bacterium]